MTALLRRASVGRTPAQQVRSTAVWAARYGVTGLVIRGSARRGDLISRAIADPATLGDPTAMYAPLRDLGLLGSNSLVSATARHAVVNEVLRSDAFDVEPAGAPTRLLDRVLTAALDRRALGPIDVPGMLSIQPPDHTRIRRLVTHAFTPRAIAGYAGRIRAMADDLLDRIDPDSFDIVADYAERLPVAVIAEIIGVPADRHAEMLQAGNDIAPSLDPVLSLRDWRTADAAARRMHVFLDEHIAALRRAPGDDLLSALIRISDEDGERLSDEELRVNTILLLGAGFETTVNLIGNAVGLLLRHRDQLASLQDDPDGWPAAVDEVLRYESPIQSTLRMPRHDTEVAGVRVPARRPVLLMIGAANRDPDVFADAERFDVTRADARLHLAFSAGIHYCVGAQLARLEASIALQALFERFPALRSAAPPVRRRTRILFGWERYPVTAGALRS